MNSKKAKALRKEIGFHPTDERKYNAAIQFTGLKFVQNPRTRVNHETSTRAKYQEAKRAAK